MELRVTIADSIAEDLKFVADLAGVPVAEIVRQGIQAVLRRHNNDLVARRAAERRASVPKGTKMPDSAEVRDAKKAYRLLRAMLASRKAASPNANWDVIDRKIEAALVNRDWGQLHEWAAREVLVVKRDRPSGEVKWVQEQLGWTE